MPVMTWEAPKRACKGCMWVCRICWSYSGIGLCVYVYISIYTAAAVWRDF